MPILSLVATIVLSALLVPGCNGGRGSNEALSDEGATAVNGLLESRVRTGAEILAKRGFDLLADRRVGIIANHTSRIDTVHLGDLLADAPEVNLAAFFAPEHGIRGIAEAGETVAGSVDARTGSPVYSLYGDTRKPTPEMLRDIDVLVFDIQDVGARFYTYISTMGLSMQAAAEAGVAFVVLDRPNPLGGEYVGGYVLEREHTSFVGQFAIPIAHGLTIGELARLIQGERLLDGLEELELHVVAMEGWSRDKLWPDTGLPWRAPSPNLPDFETALVYPGTCLFEAVNGSEGRGTFNPFKQVGAPYADGLSLVQSLERRNLPGVRFEAVTFTPQPIPQMATNPRFAGTPLGGVRIVIEEPAAYLPVEVGIHMLDAFRMEAQRMNQALLSRPDWLTRLAGTEKLGAMLANKSPADVIIESWGDEVERFRQRRRPYLLY